MDKNKSEESGQPGVSGKTLHGNSWFNAEEFHKQKDFLRKDQSEQNIEAPTEAKIFDVLKASPEVDASHVRVRVEGDIIILEGIAEDGKEARTIKKVVETIPGVGKVVSRLHVERGTES